jgi:hypothetical protein
MHTGETMTLHGFSAAARAITAMVLLASASTTGLAADGLNLSWDSCYGEGTGVQNRRFACDTNAGRERLTGSFRLDTDASDVSAMDGSLHVIAGSDQLPDWWQFRNPGTCRRLSISLDETTDPDWQVCQPWAPTGSGMTVTNYCTNSFPCRGLTYSDNDARIFFVGGIPISLPVSLSAGIEYFVFNLYINHANTVGTGGCAGCAVPVCILFDSVQIGRVFELEDRLLTLPASPGSNVVTWQGGAVPITGQTATCPAATPARNSTWGGVKSLYR